jgi:hypothetical protein
MDQWTNEGRITVTRLAVALAVLLAVITAATGATQQKPNFTGTWIVVTPAEGAGQEQEVRHTPATLSKGHASEGGGHHATYKLDGTESRNEITSHGEPIITLSKALWDGDKVVITSATTYPDGRKLETKEIWSLDSTGRLVIEMTMAMPGMPMQSMTVVHRKKDK